jgi:2-polyprenyl-3-methyl-5-hydroxy-6-metoxy-1,4-benzoquinol methylase
LGLSAEAQAIIHRLRTDPAAYQAAALKEGEVWGKTFSSASYEEIRAADQRAAAKLRLRRGQLALPKLAREYGWSFENALSLGCGSGRAERNLAKHGICKHIHGIDVSHDAIGEACRLAAEEGLAITYSVGDLNSPDLGRQRYDLVITQTCLHHVLELENLANAIVSCLRPNGLLWIDDFIGETQFQWLDARLTVANNVLAILPEQYRYSRMTKRPITRIERRSPGTLVSPFESIRSGEIVPIFNDRFDTLVKAEQNAIMQLICPVGTRENYVGSEDGTALFECLLLLDQTLINTNALPPLSGQYVLRRR